MEISLKLRLLIIFLAVLSWTQDAAMAFNGVPALLPMQGRLTDSTGSPVNYTVTVNFRIYPPETPPPSPPGCYIYEDTQTVTPNAFGVFSVLLGASGNSTGPANSIQQVFNNDTTTPLANSCASTYTPAAGDWRILEIVVGGTPMPTYQTIAAAAFSINSQFLDGLPATGFVQTDSTDVTQAHMVTLTNGSDASALHNHDSLYMKLNGTNSATGNLVTTANIYADSATSQIGIGTNAPVGDLDIVKTSPVFVLTSTAGSGGVQSIDFDSGVSQRAAIQSSESTDDLRFYTGSSLALQLDASQNALFSASLSVTGTMGLGKYASGNTSGQEGNWPAPGAGTLLNALSTMGASAVGTVWVNSSTDTLRYWDGSQPQSVASLAAVVNTVTAGTGLSNSGTATNPILNVTYGTIANTALQGNQAAGGDLSGTLSNLQVNKIQGYTVNLGTAPTNGQVLTYNSAGAGSWVPSNTAPDNTKVPLAGGTMTGALTFDSWATPTRPTSPAVGETGFNTTLGQLESWSGTAWVSGGATSVTNVAATTPLSSTGGSAPTISIPQATGSQDGYLASSDWAIFNAKQNALSFGNVTESSSDVLAVTGGNNSVVGAGVGIQVKKATTSQDGYLSSTDWATFNSKANSFSTGNLTEASSDILTVTGGDNSVVGAGTSIQVKKATTSQDGYLSSTDWTTFNGKITSVGVTAPLASTGGTSPTLSIPQATTSQSGFLASGDWTTFNGKVNKAGDTMTGALTFATWTTVTRPASPATGETGYNTTIGQLESWNGTSWSAGAAGTVTSVGAAAPLTSSGGGSPVISMPQATTSQNGFLASADWATFNAKQSALSLGNVTESTSDVLTVTGGDGSVIGAGTSIQVKKATTSQDGYLSSTDWTTFNDKQAAISLIDGSVVYYNGGVAQDNSNFFYDSTHHRLGLGTATPSTTLNVYGQGEVNNTTATSVPLVIMGANGQSAHFQEWQNNTGTIFYSLDSSGAPVANSDLITKGSVNTTLNSYLPLTGGTMTGALNFATWTTVTRPASPIAGTTGYNTTLDQLESWSGTAWIAGNASTVTNVGASAPLTSSGGSTPDISMPQATTSQSGYLASSDWATFNGKANSFSTGNLTESTSDILTVTGGDGILFGGNATVQVKKATTSQDGYLSSTDWTTFNGKQDALSFGNVMEATSDVLTVTGGINSVIGGGTSIQVKKATTSQDGYLSSTDWATFNGKQNNLGYAPVNKAGDSMSGALTFTTWSTVGRPSSPTTGETGYNTTLGQLETWSGTAWVAGSAGTVSSVGASAPLISSGGSSPDISMPQATTSQSGYLASSDWATFNAKANSFSSGNLSESTSDVLTVTGGDGILVGGNATVQVKKATTSQDGFLSSTDWATFNGKANSFSTNNVDESTSDVLTIANGNGAIIGSSALTIQVKKATTSQDGYLSSTDWTTFNGKQASLGYTPVNKAGDSMSGALTFDTWITTGRPSSPATGETGFNTTIGDLETWNGTAWVSGSAGSVDSVTATSPLTNTGSASAVVLDLPQATTSQSGYLASSDWATFNAKANSFSTNNVDESTSDVLTISNGNGAIIGSSALTIQVKKATTSQDGYLTSTDWTTFNGKVNKAGDTMTGGLTISKPGAAVVPLTIQQTNAPSVDMTDWLNNAGTILYSLNNTGTPSTGTDIATKSYVATVASGVVDSVSVTAPLTNSGSASAVVLNIPQSTTSQSGYLASSDWATFNGKENAFSAGNLTESTSDVLTVTGGNGILVGGNASVQVKKATTSQDGYLSSTDWTTFNTKQGALSFGNVTESTSDVLTVTGGTDSVIGAGTSIQVKKATTSQDGYLSSTDWTTFNSKAASFSTNNVDESTSDVLTIANGNGAIIGSSAMTIQVKKATTSQDGYLSSTDWTTFNGKQANLGYTPVNKAGDSMSGALTFDTWITTGRPSSPTAGETGFNTTLGQLETWSGSAWVAGSAGTVSSVGASAPLTSSGGSAPDISMPQATTSQSGYLASSDWATFNGKENSFSTGNLTESTSDILTVTGGDGILFGGNATVQVKKATTSQDGYLSSTDWTTFNGKQDALSFGNVTEATSDVLTVTGGINSVIGVGTSIQVKKATTSQDGYLSSTDWTTFNSKGSGTVTTVSASGPLAVTNGSTTPNVSLPQATTSQSGYLASSDWATFNGKANSFSTNNVDESTSDVLTIANGTGAIIGSSALTIQVKKATTSQDGYLSSTDWATFNGKASSFSTGNLSESTSDVLTVTGGDGILVGGNASVQVKKATTSQDGYLSSADWTTFNGKQANLGYTPVNKAGDSMSGALTFDTWITTGRPSSPTAGETGFNTSLGQLETWSGSAWVAGSAGTVSSVGASAPLTSSGGSAPDISMPQATTSQSGYLASSDWATFNGKENSFSTGNLSESTSDVLTVTGGTGILVGGNATVQVKKATTSQDGFLSSTDWTTFNGKANSFSTNNVTEATSDVLTISNGTGAIIGASAMTVQVKKATTSQDGYLSSADWATFNGKASSFSTGNLSESTSDVLTVTGGTGILVGGNATVQVKKATTSQDGFLSSTDWTTFNSKGNGTVTTVSASGPLAVTNGSTTPNVSMPQATTSQSGYLASSDWATFNGKQSSLSFGNVTESTSDVLTVTGGTGSVIGAGTSIQVKKATTSQDGYLSSTDWTTFNSKAASFSTNNMTEATSDVLTISNGTGAIVGASAMTVQVKKATTSQDGYLSSTDWTTFNSKGSGSVTTVSASGPLAVTNGSTTPNVSMPQATTSQSGYLASSDWATFNGKENSFSTGNLSESTSDVLTVTGGTGILVGGNATVQVKKATTSQDGFLSSTDWTTFNSKGSGTVTTVSASGPLAVTNGSTTPNVSMPQATTSQSGYLASSDWTTFNGKANSFSTNNVTEATSDVLTISNGTGAIIGASAMTVQVKKATTSQDGYLSSTDWTTFNSKGSGTVTTVTASGPLAVTNGSTTPNVSLPQATTSQSGYLASSDWTTFNSKQAGLGYTPVNKAGDSMTGGLTISKPGAAIVPLTIQQTSAPSVDMTDWLNNAGTILYSLNDSGTPSAGTDLATKSYVATVASGVVNSVSVNTPLTNTGSASAVVVNLPQATTSQSGYLASSDWTTFNSKESAFSAGNLTESTSDVLTVSGGSGILVGGNATVQVKKATTSQDGYLSSTDWTTFNGKQSALTLGSLTESTSDVLTVSGGSSAIIGAGLTLQVKKATTSQDGYLASTDWTTFNGKLTKTGDTMSGTLTTSAGTFVSTVADSATAKAFSFNTSASYSTAGDDLLSIQNNGTQEWGVDHAGNVTELGTLNLPSNGLVVGTTQIAMSGGEIGIGTAAPAALLHVESSSYVSPQMILEDGMTSAIPAYPSSYTPALTVAISETTGSRPLYFGYVSGGAWGATLTTGACGAFSQMCVDMGNGGTVDTALENAGTTLDIGGGADGNFTAVTFENSGVTTLAGTNVVLGNSGTTTIGGSGTTTTIGANGTAFTNTGVCTVGTFTAAAGANAETCTGIRTASAVHCSPETSQGSNLWSAWASANGTVTIVSSAAGVSSKWVCMFMQ